MMRTANALAVVYVLNALWQASLLVLVAEVAAR